MNSIHLTCDLYTVDYIHTHTHQTQVKERKRIEKVCKQENHKPNLIPPLHYTSFGPSNVHSLGMMTTINKEEKGSTAQICKYQHSGFLMYLLGSTPFSTTFTLLNALSFFRQQLSTGMTCTETREGEVSTYHCHPHPLLRLATIGWQPRRCWSHTPTPLLLPTSNDALSFSSSCVY